MMTLLEYLVPSRHRRALLGVLLTEKRPLTVRQLAHRAGMPYSSAFREVAMLQKAGALTCERARDSWLCRWSAARGTTRALRELLTGAQDRADEGTVFANLKRWKAPLLRTASSTRDMSLEETLARALALARHHSEVALVWPVAFARNSSRVNLADLEQLARRMGQKRALGFFLSLTGQLLHDPALSKRAKRLRDARAKRTRDFFTLPLGRRARKLAEENTPALAKRWLFRMNMPLQSFESMFRKFEGADENVPRSRDPHVPAGR